MLQKKICRKVPSDPSLQIRPPTQACMYVLTLYNNVLGVGGVLFMHYAVRLTSTVSAVPPTRLPYDGRRSGAVRVYVGNYRATLADQPIGRPWPTSPLGDCSAATEVTTWSTVCRCWPAVNPGPMSQRTHTHAHTCCT